MYDLINNFLDDRCNDSDRPFSGWSISYSVEIIVQQLYGFYLIKKLRIIMVN